MAKGEEYKIRKKNKENRKKLQKDPSSVSARVAALIASKKRRQSGKRRQCQGMCFSLPTPDDPFNDRHGKEDVSMSKIKKLVPQSNDKGSLKRKPDGVQANTYDQKGKSLKQMDLEDWKAGNSGCPSKFVFLCLNSIQEYFLGDGELNKDLEKPLFVNPWGVEFWKSYSLGNDILENSGNSPSMQQIAWMASTAADGIEQNKEGVSSMSPYMLYLVSSQEKAIKVRNVCKPLKAKGIHTVSLHPGASIQHQVHGLKSCEPEFLVATPERLSELVSLKAVDISGVSLLVVDGTDSLSNCLDVFNCIKDSISGNHRTVVFHGCSNGGLSVQSLRSILREPYHTLSWDKSIRSQ